MVKIFLKYSLKFRHKYFRNVLKSSKYTGTRDNVFPELVLSYWSKHLWEFGFLGLELLRKLTIFPIELIVWFGEQEMSLYEDFVSLCSYLVARSGFFFLIMHDLIIIFLEVSNVCQWFWHWTTSNSRAIGTVGDRGDRGSVASTNLIKYVRNL